MKKIFAKLLHKHSAATAQLLADVQLHSNCDEINWTELHQSLIRDGLDNGRSAQQLQQCFENSTVSQFAQLNQKTIAMSRALSDGVCNAYIVDVWVAREFRKHAIGKTLVTALSQRLQGQHIYLYTERAHGFYEKMGFTRYGTGYAKIVGQWLNKTAADADKNRSN